jgi:hypothetical protein
MSGWALGPGGEHENRQRENGEHCRGANESFHEFLLRTAQIEKEPLRQAIIAAGAGWPLDRRGKTIRGTPIIHA